MNHIDVVVDDHFKKKTFFIGQRNDGLLYCIEQLPKAETLRVNLHFAGFDLGEVQQVIDDFKEVLAAGIHIFNKRFLLRRKISGEFV